MRVLVLVRVLLMRTLLAAALIGGVSLAATQGPEGTAVVRGRVVDAITGKALGHVPVSLTPPYDSLRYRPPQRSTVTDADGNFQVTAVAAGDYSISASPAGDYLGGSYGQRSPRGTSRTLTIVDNDRLTVTVTAWPSASVRGFVRDDQGRPVAEAHVILVNRDGNSSGNATSDDRGEYLFPKVVPGEYTAGVPVNLTSRTIKNAPQPRSPNGYIPEFQPFLLDRGGRTILMAYGAGLPPSARNGQPNVYVTTYYGGASLGGATYCPLAAGQARSGIDIVLRDRPGYRVSGVATTGTGAVPGVVLHLESEHGVTGYASGTVTAHAAADGSFVFVAVPAGRYQLRAYRRNPPFTEVSFTGAVPLVAMDDYTIGDPDALSASLPLVVAGDAEGLMISLRAGTSITGRIVLDDGTEPAFGNQPPRLSLAGADGDAFFERSAASIKVNPNGTITGRAVPGTYVLRADSTPQSWSFRSLRINGRETASRAIEVGDEPIALELTYSRGIAQLAGQVSDERGAPARDASIVVFPVDERTWDAAAPPFSIVRIEQPRRPTFSISGLMAGEYYVAAVDETAHRVSLTPAGLKALVPLATRVRVEPGQPVSINLVMHEAPER